MLKESVAVLQCTHNWLVNWCLMAPTAQTGYISYHENVLTISVLVTLDKYIS